MKFVKFYYLIFSICGLFILSANKNFADEQKGKEKIFSCSFVSDPGLKIFKGEDLLHNRKVDTIEGTLSLPSTGGKGFIVEFDIEIKKFNHYGRLWIGLKNSSNDQKIYCLFQKSDDRVARCYFEFLLAPGLLTEGKPLENMQVGKYRYKILYNSSNKYVEWMVLNEKGEQLYDSGKVKIGGYFEVNEFWIKVFDKKNSKISDISYDSEKQSIFVMSYMGSEGNYPYVIEGYIDNLIIRYLED